MRVRRIVRTIVVTSLVAGGLATAASPAVANFHLMKVREVFGGTSTNASADFVELQMYEGGQNFVGGHTLNFYNASGTPTPFVIPGNVPNGQSQRSILFATTQAESALGVQADFEISNTVDGTGGAVCFETIDCVSWGTFSGSLPSSAGTPFPGGIPAGQSLDRKISPGCATLLEDGDDTNSSANDFQAVAPTPRPNSAAPTETACAPGGSGGGGGGAQGVEVQDLKAKARGNRAIIQGQITPPAPGKSVSLTLFANGSPLKKAAKGKDELNADSRFKKSLRVPKESTRCKVRIRFEGSTVGQKRFKC